MVYLFIALLVALALAPLLQFLPSRRQREQAGLREAAALAGLYVEFRDLPLPPRARGGRAAPEGQVLYYGLRLPPPRGGRRAAQAWWREGAGWAGAPKRTAPPEAVAALPSWALAVGIDDASCGVYWREDAGPEAVSRIAEALSAWRELEAQQKRASLDP